MVNLMNREALKGIGLLLLMTVICPFVVAKSENIKQPNVLFILVDDMGWEDASYMGSEYYRTPNIDTLAGNGMRFSQAYANPNCAPSRASLMSGLYSSRTKMYTVAPKDRGSAKKRRLLTPQNSSIVESERVTLAEQFKVNGYATGFFGKWHLGDPGEPTGPLAQGFDVNLGGNHKGHPKSYFSPYRNKQLKDGKEGEYLTDRLTSEAIQFIDQAVKKDKPFFAFLSYYAVHTPIQPKRELVDKYAKVPFEERQGHPGYAAMVETLDNNVGRLMAHLKASGINKDTLVVFTSDNGGSSKATTMPSLRGAKGTLYEGGVRIPLIYSWPGKIASTDNATPTMILDHYPTLLNLLGLSEIPVSELDGEDLTPLLLSSATPEKQLKLNERPIFWHFPFYLEGYNPIKAKGKNKKNKEFIKPVVATPHGWRAEPSGSVRIGNYKLIEYMDGDMFELYDLSRDLKEQHNLASSNPAKVKELYQVLSQWRQTTGADMPPGKNPKYKR